jgi:hypothetical protein
MFENLFGKKQNDDGGAKLQAAITGYRADVITAAERKLDRSLTQEERSGIERIGSLMMLESCYHSFTSEQTTADRVQKDVSYFVSQASSNEKA